MKQNEIHALHEKNLEQLKKELAAKRKELTRLQLERKVKPQKNTRIFRMLHSDIARIFTVMQEILLKEKKAK